LHTIAFPKRPLLPISAVAVLSLTVLSYLLLLALAAACVILPLELVGFASKHLGAGTLQSLMLLAVGAILAIVILWSLIPQRETFEPFGLQIKLQSHPRLEQLLKEVTTCLGEPMPDEIYLTSDANAGVSERGGFLGIGSSRVMCLGLPLMVVMSESELRATVAHECAHFYTGDTWLAPRVYSARSAIAKILARLTQESTLTDALSKFGLGRTLHLLVTVLLTQYWKVFSLAENYVSRLQEYRSDELAAFIAGPQAVMSGLSKINRAQMILHTFWSDVIYPVLDGGLVPPVAESFRHLGLSPSVVKATEDIYSAMLQDSQIEPNSTHPPLKLRLQKLEKLCGEMRSEEGESALSLLNDLEALERGLLEFMFKNIKVSELPAAEWDTIGSKVYLQTWRAEVQEHLDVLAKYTVERVPDLLADLSVLTGSMRNPAGILLTREQRAGRARDLIWKSLALKLIDQGWRLAARPGTLHLVKEGQRFTPEGLMPSPAGDKTELASWFAFYEDNGLSNASLA